MRPPIDASENLRVQEPARPRRALRRFAGAVRGAWGASETRSANPVATARRKRLLEARKEYLRWQGRRVGEPEHDGLSVRLEMGEGQGGGARQ